MIRFSLPHSSGPDPRDESGEYNPPSCAWEEDVEQSLRDKISMLEEEVDILHGTSMKLRALLAASVAVLGALEHYAKAQRGQLGTAMDEVDG